MSSIASDAKAEAHWKTFVWKFAKRKRLLKGLEREALSRLASADMNERAHMEAGNFDHIADTAKMELAVETYRLLPLIIRAKLENWTIDSAELQLGKRLTKSPAPAHGQAGLHEASYRRLDVAVKIWEGDLLVHSAALQSIHSELTVLAQLRHPNIIVFIGASIESQSCAIVTEFMHGGSLQELLDRNNNDGDGRPWRPGRRRTLLWALDLLRAINYMHQSEPRVAHRDIRPANLLLTSGGTLKVAGFSAVRIISPTGRPARHEPPDLRKPRRGSAAGRSAAAGGRRLSRSISLDGRRMHRRSSAGASTGASDGAADAWEEAAAPGEPAISRYLAPELHPAWAEPGGGGGGGGGGALEDRADVYGAAMVVWTVFAGAPPHEDLSDGEAAAAAADPAERLRPPTAGFRWPGLAALLDAAWAHDPARRPAAEELMDGLEALLPVSLRAPACASACRVA
jgi:serine/threonine protein kinase